ncbi:MAG: 50S ribosomal protein L9 [Chlamydiales bacterium]
MKQQLLLLDDIDGLGRSGDLVSAKPGFIRNFLIPQKKAVVADKHTLKMQAFLKEEREKKARIEKKEAEALAARLDGVIISTEVKVDPDGKMYGSVTILNIVRLMESQGYLVDRKHILLSSPIKEVGKHTIKLKLPEDVFASFILEVKPEEGQSTMETEEIPSP